MLQKFPSIPRPWAARLATGLAILAAAGLPALAAANGWEQLGARIDDEQRNSASVRSQACTERDEALRALLLATTRGSAQLSAAMLDGPRGVHRQAQARCAKAESRLALASRLWNDFHAAYAQPCVGTRTCAPDALAQRLTDLQAGTDADPAPAATNKPDDPIQAALSSAATAQERVAAARQKATGAYAIGDKAAAVGLSTAAAAPSEAAGNEQRQRDARDLAAQGQKARAAALRAESQKSEAQRQANTLVAQALDLAQCRLNGPCPNGLDLQLRNVQASEKRLQATIELIEADYKTAKAQRWAQEVQHVGEGQRDQALRYLQVLDENPDATALVGEDAALFSASTKGTEGTVRISFKRLGVGWLRRANLAFSTPLTDGSAVLLERRADRLSKRPHVRFSVSRVEVPETGFLIASFGLTAGVGRDTLPYVDVADLSKPASLRTNPFSLGLTTTVIFSDSDALALKTERQETWEQGEASVTCPLPATGATSVTCLNGTVGMPQRSLGTVSNLEYRRRITLMGAPAGISIGMTYDSAKRHFDVSVPVYLIRSADSEKGELNAGLRFGWANKQRGNSVGVFVTTPFSLGGS